MVSIRHSTLAANRPAGGLGAVQWDADHTITGLIIGDVTGLQAALDAKQALLVSGTSLKTVNGQSLLGSGDLVVSGGGGSSAWGGITGTLSAQTDLQTALNARQPLSAVLTGTTASFTTAQETKLAGIAAGATANATDALLRDRSTHTGTQPATSITGLAAVATSGSAADLSAGTLLAARLPALTGDVTSAAGTAATTIANGAVTLAKMANLAANSIIGNNTGSAAAPVALGAAQLRTLINVADGATANATDALLRDRTTHTGAQAISTVTGLQAALDTKAAAGANADITSLRQSTAIAATGEIAASGLGFRGIPASSQTKGAAITLALSDIAKKVRNTVGGWIIPANAALSFPPDIQIVLYNESNSPQTVSIGGTDTLRWAGTTLTGPRTVAPRGYCVLHNEAPTEWVAQGNIS